ncbi:UPF0147 family protein [Candidatus Woesearchaeota archaeon]|nr:UPF0147 family protein [Candidatus Woesearchaeota archaeon]
MSSDILTDIIAYLEELKDDTTVPKNVKLKVERTMNILKENTDLSIRINKALSEIEDISDDANLQAFTRTQVWNIVSMLEKVN